MISMIRVDDRLIHGQVAVVWSRFLGVDRIVVANDEILENKTQIMALKMAVPAGIKPFFISIEDTIKLLSNPKSDRFKILVVVNKPEDALKVLKEVPQIPLVNLGNYGRMNNYQNDVKKQQLSKNIFVTNEDKHVLNELMETGVKVNIQAVPAESDIQLKDVLK